MNVHIGYKLHKTPDIEREIAHLIEKVQVRLQVFRPELVHLKGSLEPASAHGQITFALNLRLPSGQMTAEESASTATAAIKAGLDSLLHQIKKHKDLLRSSHKWTRRRNGVDRSQPQVPFESTFAAMAIPAVSAEDVRSYVNVNLGRLDRFIERELFFRESADQILPEAICKEEVIDEVIARALDDGEKPERVTLEPWLYRLALRAIDDLSHADGDGSASVPLEASARKPNVRASDEPELQYHQPDETLTEESVIADRRTATPEDIASSDELIALVQAALRGSPPQDREALILYAIEGFTVEEIAVITDRGAVAVRSSIAAARRQVRASPPLSGRWPGRFLQTTGTD